MFWETVAAIIVIILLILMIIALGLGVLISCELITDIRRMRRK